MLTFLTPAEVSRSLTFAPPNLQPSQRSFPGACSPVDRHGSCPEAIERFLVGVVAANFDDLAFSDTHQLTASDVKVMALTFGGRVLYGNDVVMADRYVDQLSAERPTRKRRELCEELVPDCRPAVMATRDRAVTGKNPYGVRRKARAGGVEVALSERLIEAPHNLGVCSSRRQEQIIAGENGRRLRELFLTRRETRTPTNLQ